MPKPLYIAHAVEDGDGVCGDCTQCRENLDDVCIVAEKFRCAWCGYCTRNHAHRAAPGEGALRRLQREEALASHKGS